MSSPSFISPRRIIIIAHSTVTQLVRMKVFYFLAPVALLFVGLQFFDAPWYDGPDALAPEQELRMHKNIAMGTMMIFSSLFAVVAMALLIPGDISDRTIYTILCKPVPRMDYLLGKYLGVVVVIFVAMAVMDALLVATLQYRTERTLVLMTDYLQRLGYPDGQVEREREAIAAQGPTLLLQYGVLAHFLKAAVMAAVALLLATLSTSTLFTIATGVMIWVIGAFQSIARDGLFNDAKFGEVPSTADEVVGKIIAVIFPDFQLFEAIADASARAENVVTTDLAQLGGLAGLYIGMYVVLSWFVYRDKEF